MRPPKGARGAIRKDKSWRSDVVIDVEEVALPKVEEISPPRSVCVVSEIVKDHPDQATINVITKLLNVFAPAWNTRQDVDVND